MKAENSYYVTCLEMNHLECREQIVVLKEQLRLSEWKARDLADKLVDELFAHEETRKQMLLL